MEVKSSHIESADYFRAENRLEVTFKNGLTYHYAGVPPEKWDAFKAAESQGKYLHTHIKPHHPSLLAGGIVPESK